MKFKRVMIILILLIFTTGMLMGTASAEHTFTVGKYKAKVSDKQYNKLKKYKKKGKEYSFKAKTTNKYTVKKSYKYKTVYKKKWVYKKVLVGKTVYSYDFMDSDYYDYNYRHSDYVAKGWKYCGYKIVKSNGGKVIKTYDKFKKKKSVKTKVKVATSKKKKSYVMDKIGRAHV